MNNLTANQMENALNAYNTLVSVLGKRGITKDELDHLEYFKHKYLNVDDSFKIIRKSDISTKDLKIGDQMLIHLENFGDFTATVQKITNSDVTFMFNDCIAERKMNEQNSNFGKYHQSDLKWWLETEFLDSFPIDLRVRLIDISIPTYGQIFGHDDFYKNFVPDNDEQFELMKQRKNRVADYKNDYSWYWLQNATKENVSSTRFAYVLYSGGANCTDASASFGVRPVFRLKLS